MGFEINKNNVAIDPLVTLGKIHSLNDIKNWAIIASKFPDIVLPLAVRIVKTDKNAQRIIDMATNKTRHYVKQTGMNYLRSLGLK